MARANAERAATGAGRKLAALLASAAAAVALAPLASAADKQPPTPVAAPPCPPERELALRVAKVMKRPVATAECRPGRFPAPGWAVLARSAQSANAAGRRARADDDDPESGDVAGSVFRLLGVLDPASGALRAGAPDEIEPSDANFSTERIEAVLDLDGDGADEIVTDVDYDRRGVASERAAVDRVAGKEIVHAGRVPISFESHAGTEGRRQACEGKLSIVSAAEPGGPALRLRAKATAGKPSADDCLPGQHLFRLAAGKLVSESEGPAPGAPKESRARPRRPR